MGQIVFMNGALVDAGKARISVMNPGLSCGWGVFETMRSLDSRIVYFDAHLTRLSSGAKRLAIKIPFSVLQLKRAVRRTVEANGFRDSAVRLSVYQGLHGSDTIITARRYVPYPQQIYQKGFHASLSDCIRSDDSWLTGLKSTSRLAYELAYRQAEGLGFDEALIRTPQGHMSEGTRSNLFLVSSRTLLTPPLSSGCLAGITRRVILDLARKERLRCRQGDVSLETLYGAQEAFLTNSLLGVMPLTSVNKHAIGNGKRGRLTSFFIEKYGILLRSGA